MVVAMDKTIKMKEIDERILALRKELGDRILKIMFGGTNIDIKQIKPEIIEKIRRINGFIKEEKFEKAKEEIKKAIKKHPNDPDILNLQMLLEFSFRTIDSENTDYTKIREIGCRILESAVNDNLKHQIVFSLNNLGVIANFEGLSEYSKALYLAAHYIDKDSYLPLLNLVAWSSRKNLLDEAMEWVYKIIDKYPDWLENKEIRIFFANDESLHKLRSYDIFKNEVLNKIKKKGGE